MRAQNERVKTGLDCLQNNQFQKLKNARVAVLGHPASINSNLESLYDVLQRNNVNIVRLFGPEHGFFGSAQDMESVTDSSHGASQIPVFSLYGQSRKTLMLNPELLKDVDILLCDLQDIGSRYYTFIYTLAFALSACASAGIKCIVLDRPNPIGGIRVEGNLVRSDFQSFVGEYSLPIQHGLTIGELAHYFKKIDNLDVDLEVIWMENWTRNQYFDETGLPWVFPSPNMPSLDTALLYPGLCLIEGTNLSEGRGTTRPFELVGAPYIDDPTRFAQMIGQEQYGVKLRPCWFKPMFQKHSQKLCGGLQIHIVDRQALDPINLGIALMLAAQEFQGFAWRNEPYEFESSRLAIDLLFGDDQARHMVEAKATSQEILSYLNKDLPDFLSKREALLHANYGDSASI